MFIFKVIRNFFRNKSTEIKRVFSYSNRKWTDFLELLLIIPILIVVISLFFGILYGTGYMLTDVLGWINITFEGGETIPYAAIGISFYIVVIIGFVVLQFFKWIWTNIKMAIAEAKEYTK
jgi:hypothetical protein